MKHLFPVTLLIAFFFAASSANAQIIKTIAGNGTAGYSGNGGLAVSAALDHPDAAKLDRSGNIYIADERNHAIRKISTSGIISTIAGTGIQGFEGHGVPATSALLSRPVDLIFDSAWNVVIAEAGNNVISKINKAGILTIIAGTGSDGYNGDGSPATAAQIHNPMGLVYDSVGRLYFSSNGSFRIRRIDTSGIITTIAGTGISGYSGDKGPATAATLGLTGYLAINSKHEIFIPDYGNHVVRKIDTFGIITTVAGTGSMGTAGDGGPATAAAINSPYGIMFDKIGNMYISDAFDYVVRKVDTFGIISTIAGTTALGFSGDGGPATAAQFDANLYCSDSDLAGNFYIADPNNNRVRRITYNSTGVREVATLSNSSIYPNPAHNDITISTGDKIQNINVENLLGQTVLKESYNRKDKIRLDISHFANGPYLLKINGVYSGKFVKE